LIPRIEIGSINTLANITFSGSLKSSGTISARIVDIEKLRVESGIMKTELLEARFAKTSFCICFCSAFNVSYFLVTKSRALFYGLGQEQKEKDGITGGYCLARLLAR
jgi:hypothetical protein